MLSKINFDVQEYSDVGKRVENQDNFSYKLLEDNVFIGCVADGVGGKFGGSLASKISVDLFIKEFSEGSFELNKLYDIPYKINK